MIFVTVGTHEQPFDRLIREIDLLKKEKKIQENVILQTGFSEYKPTYCNWSNFLSYNEMTENMKSARIIITHGGPASFIMPLQFGKVPIVVPRQKKYNEHVNNHQVEFTRNVAKRMQNIIMVENISKLEETIKYYNDIVASMEYEIRSNNINFNKELEQIVTEIFNV